jgi:hypothetical protein
MDLSLQEPLFFCHCELAEGKRGNHILYSPHSLSFHSFTYSRFSLFVIAEFSSPCHCEERSDEAITYSIAHTLFLPTPSLLPTSLYLSFFPTLLPTSYLFILPFIPTSLSLLLFFPKTKNHKPKIFKTKYQLPTTKKSLHISLSQKWYGEPSPVSLFVTARSEATWQSHPL